MINLQYSFPFFFLSSSSYRYSFYFLFSAFYQGWGPRWRSWLRHCATSQKVTGSIPDGVIGIFHLHNPSGRILHTGCRMSTRVLIRTQILRTITTPAYTNELTRAAARARVVWTHLCAGGDDISATQRRRGLSWAAELLQTAEQRHCYTDVVCYCNAIHSISQQKQNRLAWTCIREISGSDPARHTAYTVRSPAVFSVSPSKFRDGTFITTKTVFFTVLFNSLFTFRLIKDAIESILGFTAS